MSIKEFRLADKLFVTADRYPQFLQTVSVLVGLVHVVVLFLLWNLDMKPLACFNIISIVVYVSCFFLSKSNKHFYTVYMMLLVEVVIFSLLMTLFIKENLAFSAYAYALICFSAITKYMIDTEEKAKGTDAHMIAQMLLLSVLFLFEVYIGNRNVGVYSIDNNLISLALLSFNNVCAVACTIIGTVTLLTISVDKDVKMKRALEEAEELRGIAESANSAKSEFLASMSHEIRTPINAVLGMDNMILMESEDENILSYATDIKNAGNTLLSLINDILDTSKIEAGGMTVEPIEYAVSSLINDCYSIALVQATEKDLTLDVNVNAFIPSGLYGDEDRIRQTIINILSNAIKYTRTGGVEFTVDYEQKEDDFIDLIIVVKDTGIGIAPENIDKIFTSFKRVDSKKNRSILGTGLGLSITKQLVELMDGTISVESTLDVGSTFTVRIPQKIVKHTVIGEFSPKSDAVITDKVRLYAPEAHILVVDDMDVNLRVIKGLLKTSKINIDTADCGQKCISLAKKNKYDIIFLDHMMPDMDGFETYDALVEDGENINKDTPIIMLTANAISGAKEEYLSRGFADYLSKPVMVGELIELLVKYLPKEYVSFKEKEKKKVTPKKEESGLAERFSFLDINAGLLYNGSDDELYIATITDYYNEDFTNKISEMFNAKDYKKYSVYTHSLKSSSLSIGAIEMHEKAKAHETAAKAGDYDFVRDNFEDLMETYRRLRDDIKGALGV